MGATGAHRFTFHIPANFISLVSIGLRGFSNNTNAVAPIDFTSEYCAVGEIYNNHTQSQIGGTEAFVLDTLFEFDVSGLFSLIAAGDECGLLVDHQGIGATLQYTGLRLTYTGTP